MQTLVEASFNTAITLNEIAEREGRAVNIIDVQSIEREGDGTASIYLGLDDPSVDGGMGCEGFIIYLVNERAIAGMNHDDILAALTNDDAHTIH